MIQCNKLLLEESLHADVAVATKRVGLLPGIQGGCEQPPPLPEQQDAAGRESFFPTQS